MYDITKNYYTIMEVTPEATQDEIRKAFIRLSKTHHPDKYPMGSPEKKQAEKIFADITEAYSILSDPGHRRNYDEIRAGRMTEDGLPTQKKESEVNWAEHYFKEGEESMKHRETDDAVKNFREAVRLNPNIAKYHFSLGLAYVAKGWHAYAKASFAAAIKLDPNNIAAKKYLDNDGKGPSPAGAPSPGSPFGNIFKKK